MEREREG
jgi:hypothetical protein